MPKANKVIAPLVCAMAFITLPTFAFAGKVNGEKVKPEMKYKVTVCKRPERPKVKGDGEVDYQNAVLAYETYSLDQQNFADCVEREAGGDLRILQNVIFNGGQEEIAKAQRDIDALKADLDTFRTKLENAASKK
jgi:hypothetical protein